MNRIVTNPAVVLLVAALSVALAPEICRAQGGQSPLAPPQSHTFGKPFEEWNVLQTQFAIATGLGGETALSDTIGRVRLLPGEFSTPTPVFHIALSPGTPFVASPFFVYGERYDDASVPDDDPIELAPLLEEIFDDAEIQVVLDGRVLLESSGTELKRFLFGPVFFDTPVAYAAPQPRGPGLNSVAALWVMGIGAVYHPLSVGKHTLVYTVHSDFFGDFQFTYNITVSPRGAQEPRIDADDDSLAGPAATDWASFSAIGDRRIRRIPR